MNKFELNDYNNITSEILMSAEGTDFTMLMAYVLKLALLRDAGFYEWMILNFNEIMDKEESFIKNIEDKCGFIMQFFNTKDPDMKKEYKMLMFGDVFADVIYSDFEDKLSYGECMSLGMIANAFISYKRQLLSKEEYYELRDMFVPFGLTISLDPFDATAIIGRLYEAFAQCMDNNGITLLKKIGKSALYSDIKNEEIKEAFEELMVEWD